MALDTAEFVHTDTPPAFVDATLTFAERTAEKPYAYIGPAPEGVPPMRFASRTQTVRIENARPLKGRLDVDVQGFAILDHKSEVRDFWDEAQTLALGHPETAELVKAATGARRVVVFDHTLRRRAPDAPRQPVTRAHVDQTVASGPKRVREIMGEQADALLAGGAAIINVWRPIAHVARDWPLAFADARTVSPDDLISSDLIFPNRRGETYVLAHNPAQRWYYVPDLAPDEVVLLKCWDSDEGGARFAPHTGFEDPTTPPGTPPRESIEFRTIAFF